MALRVGLRVVRNRAVPSEEVDFLALFGAVVPEVANLYWVIDGMTSPFISLFYEDWEDEIEPFVVPGEDELYRPGVLTQFAAAIKVNDWMKLIGFTATSDQEAQNRARELSHRSCVRDSTEVAIFNIDGGFWEFFASGQHLTEMLLQNPRAQCEPLRWSESVSLGGQT